MVPRDPVSLIMNDNGLWVTRHMDMVTVVILRCPAPHVVQMQGCLSSRLTLDAEFKVGIGRGGERQSHDGEAERI